MFLGVWPLTVMGHCALGSNPTGVQTTCSAHAAAFTARAQAAVGSVDPRGGPVGSSCPRGVPVSYLDDSCSIHTPISVLLLFEVCGKSSLMSPLQRGLAFLKAQ